MLTADRQIRIRNALFGLLLFVGLVVWVFHSIAAVTARSPDFVHRLRVLGVMTWLYAIVLLVDMRYYHSRFARRRVAEAPVPEHMLAWLLAQMLPWYGLVYYALTADGRVFGMGIALAAIVAWAYPVPADGGPRPAHGHAD